MGWQCKAEGRWKILNPPPCTGLLCAVVTLFVKILVTTLANRKEAETASFTQLSKPLLYLSGFQASFRMEFVAFVSAR